MSTETNSDKSMVNDQSTANPKRPFGIRIVAILMIIFGIAEVGTGVTHNFLGMVSTTETNLSMYIGAALGLCYFIGGILILTGKKWAAALAVLLLCIDVAGRIFMVVAKLYPVDSFRQTSAIITGTTIAAIFAIYIITKLKYFK